MDLMKILEDEEVKLSRGENVVGSNAGMLQSACRASPSTKHLQSTNTNYNTT